MPLEVWYFDDAVISGAHDAGFGRQVHWDIPLLEGYNYRFFSKNKGKLAGGRRGFFAYSNRALLHALKNTPPSVVVVHGWNYKAYVDVLVHARKYGHQLAFRGETNVAMEAARSVWQQWLRKRILRWVLKDVSYFLSIGEQSADFYRYLGVPESKIRFTPYAVDNGRFRQEYASISQQEARQELSIPGDKFVILFSGKYIPKKRPLDLLKAFAQLPSPNKFLVMMGEGELRMEMQQFMDAHGLQAQVLLTGFVNQSQVHKYYRAANVFVMCSDYGETWGLSVNEAMNFSLPLVVSNRTGCAPDLVQEGRNGFVFPAGNVQALADALQQVMDMPEDQRQLMGKHSLELVEQYSYRVIGDALAAINA